MKMGDVDSYMDFFEEQYFPDWQADEKRPYFMATEEPLALMTYSEPDIDHPRDWSHLRRCTLASTEGYERDQQHNTPPLINWASHYFQEPGQWERIKEMHEGDRFVVNMSALALDNMYERFGEFLEKDDETVIINPPEMIKTFSHKYKTAAHLDRQDLPGIPSVRASKLIFDGEEEVEAKLGDGGEYGYVLKPFNGYGGDGVEGFDSLEEISEFLESGDSEIIEQEGEKLYDTAMIQPKIPHQSDLRVITTDEIVNAERRFSAPGELCTNISGIDGIINGNDYQVYGNALKALKSDRVMPVNVDYFEDIPSEVYDPVAENQGLLPSGARELSLDIIDSFEPEEFNYDESLPRKPFKIGIDMLEADVEMIDHLPDEARERALRYEDSGTVYFIPELNGNPGSMADLIARWSGMEEQMSPIHVYQSMRDLAGLETENIQNIVNNPESDAWRRIDAWYPDLKPSREEFLKKAGRNTD